MKDFTKNATLLRNSLGQILYSLTQKHYSEHAGKSANAMCWGILAPKKGIFIIIIFFFLNDCRMDKGFLQVELKSLGVLYARNMLNHKEKTFCYNFSNEGNTVVLYLTMLPKICFSVFCWFLNNTAQPHWSEVQELKTQTKRESGNAPGKRLTTE